MGDSMINLLKKKLEAVDDLKNFSMEIVSLSAKNDDEKISSMIVERQIYIETINSINYEIEKLLLSNEDNSNEADEIKSLKVCIRESVNEIINIDKAIRKNVNAELIVVKSKLNHPETTSKLLNIKC